MTSPYRDLQDRLLRLLGNSELERDLVVANMLHRDDRERTSYWLFLLMSVGMATMGLVVGSSAVVIGAMLVAPLMGPILALAMGLAAGSPLLVFRSVLRVVLSVVVALLGAGLITVFLPFHEVNAEIAARTTPTVLDLVTAAFCAFIGVYTSARPNSDSGTTAAGTSIGISLVPPLCAAGFGLGMGDASIEIGAGMLFLANFVAIVGVGTIGFTLLGFDRVPVGLLEQAARAEATERAAPDAIAAWFTRSFGTRGAFGVRFVMPALLLAAIYLPLRRSLDEVAWSVRARTAVDRVLKSIPQRAIETRVRVARHMVEVDLVLIGEPRHATDARTRLEREVLESAQVRPRLEVTAVPDLEALSSRFAAKVSTISGEVPGRSATDGYRVVSDALSRVEELWPRGVKSELLSVALRQQIGQTDREVVVRALGERWPDVAKGVLARALTEQFNASVSVTVTSVPPGPFSLEAPKLSQTDRGLLLGALESVREFPAVSVCVTWPAPAPSASGASASADGGKPAATEPTAPTVEDPNAELRREVEAALVGLPRVVVETDGPPQLRLTLAGCHVEEPRRAASAAGAVPAEAVTRDALEAAGAAAAAAAGLDPSVPPEQVERAARAREAGGSAGGAAAGAAPTQAPVAADE